MAECYHYEALRKQRVLERAYEARCRLKEQAEKKKFVDKAVQVGESCDESARSNRRGSRDTSRVMKRLEAVKKDLHKNELVLRDSNLVMGRISPQEELNYRYKH